MTAENSIRKTNNWNRYSKHFEFKRLITFEFMGFKFSFSDMLRNREQQNFPANMVNPPIYKNDIHKSLNKPVQLANSHSEKPAEADSQNRVTLPIGTPTDGGDGTP